MIKFDGCIVQFGFGAVGKSFFEKLPKEVQFKEFNYYVITREEQEFPAYINMGGIASNFVWADVNRENFKDVFSKYLSEGDLLIDFADTVGTRDICQWCAEQNIMYLNTGEADWADNWYSIFEENELKSDMKKYYEDIPDKNRYPIVLQHGNNPGLVSHFVKLALEYIVITQFKHDKFLKKLVKEGSYNKLAMALKLRQVHVNDIDLQQVKGEYNEQLLINTWCTDSFWFEMLSEATFNAGTKEIVDFTDECRMYNEEKGYVEFLKLAVDKKCLTYYPGGAFAGHMVPHEETITIAKSLEVTEAEKTIYRPTVAFIYSPCQYATTYLKAAKVNDYPNPNSSGPMDCERENGEAIVRGYVYPDKVEMLYKDKIKDGTEYVGVLLIGEGFKPVWVGNRIELSYLYNKKNSDRWQTPTITPVAMSALSALCWMLKNKDKGGIYFPDQLQDSKGIVKLAEKYISKTIYKTFSIKEIEDGIGIDFNNIRIKDIFV